jgi:hypothetical protein
MAAFECVHPDSATQPSTVQSLPSSQLIAACWQPVGETHVSVVQALVSLQFVGACVQPL